MRRLVIPMFMIVLMVAMVAASDGQYKNITNCSELQSMDQDFTADYQLVNDVDCSGTHTWDGGKGFEPIGNRTSPFMGTLDGNGHVVKFLSIDRPDESDVGLFGAIGSNSSILDISLYNVTVSGSGNVGALAGWNYGYVSLSASTASVKCSASGHNVGGLVGKNSGTIAFSYSTGAVAGPDSGGFVGGLVGMNNDSVVSSYSRSSARGDNDVGGLVGYNYDGGSISRSYSTGLVRSPDDPGGLVGYGHGTVSSSYWDVNTSNQKDSYGGTGKPTQLMKQESTYEGWNFTHVWNISSDVNDGYPYLIINEIDEDSYTNDSDDDSGDTESNATYNASLQVFANTSSAVVGDQVRFYVNITNHGADLPNAELISEYPSSQLTYILSNTFPPGVRYNDTNTFNTTSRSEWSVNLSSGSGAALSVLFNATSAGEATNEFALDVEVKGSNLELASAKETVYIENATDEDDSESSASYNASLFKAADSSSASVGEQITYILNISNQGADLTGAYLADEYSSDKLSFVSQSSSVGLYFNGNYVVNDSTVYDGHASWNVSLSKGESAWARVTFETKESGNVSNQANLGMMINSTEADLAQDTTVVSVTEDSINCPAGLCEDLVSYYPFDGHTDDVYGGNDGTLYGSPDITEGIKGEAYTGFGEDVLRLPNSEDFHFSGPFTYSVWVYPKSFTDGDRLLWYLNTGWEGGFNLEVMENGTLDLSFARNEGSYEGPTYESAHVNSQDALDLDRWNHIAFVRGESNQLALYIDGVKQPDTEYFNGTYTSDRNFWIPSGPVDGHRSAAIRVDELSIYGAALSPEQIDTIGRDLCNPQDYKKCYNGDVYWYDSCGNKEDLAEECDYGCKNATCVKEQPDNCCSRLSRRLSVLNDTVTRLDDDYTAMEQDIQGFQQWHDEWDMRVEEQHGWYEKWSSRVEQSTLWVLNNSAEVEQLFGWHEKWDTRIEGLHGWYETWSSRVEQSTLWVLNNSAEVEEMFEWQTEAEKRITELEGEMNYITVSFEAVNKSVEGPKRKEMFNRTITREDYSEWLGANKPGLSMFSAVAFEQYLKHKSADLKGIDVVRWRLGR